MKLFQTFLKNETGATAVEYGLIAALIAVALIGGASALGTSLDGIFNNAGEGLNSAEAPGTS